MNRSTTQWVVARVVRAVAAILFTMGPACQGAQDPEQQENDGMIIKRRGEKVKVCRAL